MSSIDLVASRRLLVLRMLVGARGHLTDWLIVSTANVTMSINAEALICLDLKEDTATSALRMERGKGWRTFLYSSQKACKLQKHQQK